MNILVVTNQSEMWKESGLFGNHKIVSDDYYLSDTSYQADRLDQIINLCSSYNYQSIGYYVSLLAEAREQKVLPSVLATQDVEATTIIPVINIELQHEIALCLQNIKGKSFELSIYFGRNIAKRYEKISRKIYGYLPLPLFKVYFTYKSSWKISGIQVVTLADIPHSHMKFLKERISAYLNKKHLTPYKQKKLTYNLAILHNPKEKDPPSNQKALQNFIQSAAKHHIFAELIEKSDFKLIREYDALFIRETTSVNHHTYLFARRAQAENLVIIDDPASIVKCSNKVYLAELMRKHNILIPRTEIINHKNWQSIGKKLAFPCVLKKPDSAFSKGVIQVKNEIEYQKKCLKFLETSEMIISQEFLPSEFDWRIGILDNKVIFACKYFMAKDHWQIYNWQDKDEPSGDFECVPIEKVPSSILSTAKNAAKLIGKGLYGVDLKQIGNKSYVIEINDNPNIDFNIEDQCAGHALYDTVMNYFQTKIKERYQYD